MATPEEILEQVKTLEKRVAEIDNSVRTHDTTITNEIIPGMKEVSDSLQILNIALQNLFWTQSSGQVLVETVVRYFAGYQVGDFTKEIGEVSEKMVAGEQVGDGFKAKPKNDFDINRFYDLAEEIDTVYKDLKAKRVEVLHKEHADEEAAKLRKPKIEIVKNMPKEL